MKQRVRSIYRIILASIMGLLGFGSCGKDPFFGGGAVMYGQPTATYKLNGTVKDQSGNPLKGIRVVYNPNLMKDDGSDNYKDYLKHSVDTLYSDAQGKFKSDKLKIFGGSDDPLVIFTDVDGAAEGGEFEELVIKKDNIKVAHKKGSGAWDDGTYTYSTDVTLKRK